MECNNVQSLSLSEEKGFSSDVVEEKLLECDHVPLCQQWRRKTITITFDPDEKKVKNISPITFV